MRKYETAGVQDHLCSAVSFVTLWVNIQQKPNIRSLLSDFCSHIDNGACVWQSCASISGRIIVIYISGLQLGYARVRYGVRKIEKKIVFCIQNNVLYDIIWYTILNAMYVTNFGCKL
jgi:hypothetical protein